MATGIQKMYTKIPSTYELINHLLTFGLDILWRKKAIRSIKSIKGERWLDVCTGTGETAAYLSGIADNNKDVFATDFSLPMVSVAKNKSVAGKIKFSISEIKNLPFPDDTFDLVTISFATRNINLNRDALVQSFSEIRRVLKTGGQFINVETSQPKIALIRSLFHIYVKMFIKSVGSVISGSKAAYSYLASSMLKFYDAENLKYILLESGFSSVEYQGLLFGAAAIHSSIK